MKLVSQLSEGSLYQTKSGRWRYAVTIGYDGRGKQIRKTVSGATKSECVKRRNELLQKLHNGALNAALCPTVAEWGAQRLANLRATAAPNTYNVNRAVINKWVVPTLGTYTLDQIGWQELTELRAAMERGGLRQTTIRSNFRFVAAMFEEAAQAELIVKNPCKGFKVAAGTPRTRTYTVEEAKKIIQSAYQAGDPLASMWLTAFMLGMRKSELLAMNSAGIQHDGSIYRVEWQRGRVVNEHGEKCGCAQNVRPKDCPKKVILTPTTDYVQLADGTYLSRPKTSAGIREIPIPPFLLAAWPKREGFFWVNAKGLLFSHGAIHNRWLTALDRAGVPHRAMHGARHTTASLLIEAGVPDETIIRILGHTSLLSTRPYIHTSHEFGLRAVENVGNVLGIPAILGEQKCLDKPVNGS